MGYYINSATHEPPFTAQHIDRSLGRKMHSHSLKGKNSIASAKERTPSGLPIIQLLVGRCATSGLPEPWNRIVFLWLVRNTLCSVNDSESDPENTTERSLSCSKQADTTLQGTASHAPEAKKRHKPKSMAFTLFILTSFSLIYSKYWWVLLVIFA